MGRPGNSSNMSRGSHRKRGIPARLITTALIERDEHVLLTQLASGRFAGFWLLPSATVDEEPIEMTTRRMVLERTGNSVVSLRLVSVLEECKTDVRTLRFIFETVVAAQEQGIHDPEIVQARWFSREAVCEVLAERDVVPTLGVMGLLRAWAEATSLPVHQLLVEDSPCPCGSGHQYPGCCGWDMR